MLSAADCWSAAAPLPGCGHPEKQTAMAAPEATEEARRTGANAARASGRTTENTQKLCYMRLNSLLPFLSAAHQIGECRDRSGMPDAAGVQCASGEVWLPPPATATAAYIAPVVPVLMRIRRVWGLAPLRARSQRQGDEQHQEPSKQFHHSLRAARSAVPTPRQRSARSGSGHCSWRCRPRRWPPEAR